MIGRTLFDWDPPHLFLRAILLLLKMFFFVVVVVSVSSNLMKQGWSSGGGGGGGGRVETKNPNLTPIKTCFYFCFQQQQHCGGR